MKPPDRRLLREIILVAVLKLLLLILLWQAFVRDHRVQPDAGQLAEHLSASGPAAVSSTTATSVTPASKADHDQ